MQNDPNKRPYYYTPPRVAGRLIGQRPSNTGLWTLFKQQSRSIQVGIITIGVLFTILLLLVPFALFSGIFANTPTVQTVQTTTQSTTDSNQSATIPTVIATDTPTPIATDTPTSTPMTSDVTNPQSAIDQPVTTNPWGYDFNPGSFITAPPSTFCTYFSCINGFWNGQGYVEECQDGMYTLGGGVGGDCDAHGGDLRPLYYHPALNAPPLVPTATPQTIPTATPQTTPTADAQATPTPKSKKSKATPTPTH